MEVRRTEQPSLILPVVLLLSIGLATVFLHVFEFRLVWGLTRALVSSFHGPGFGAVSVIVMLLLRTRMPVTRAYLVAAAGTIVFGTATEFLQVFGPRDADLEDAVHNASGVVGFLGIAALMDPAIRSTLSIGKSVVLGAISAISFTVATGPTIWYSYAIADSIASLPSLQTFESPRERQSIRRRWDSRFDIEKAPETWNIEPASVVRLTQDSERVAYLDLETYPYWSEYEYLTFMVAAQGTSDLGLRVIARDVDYRSRNRIQGIVDVRVPTKPGIIRVSINDLVEAALPKSLDRDEITGLVFRLHDADEGESLLLGDIRLE